MTPSSVAIALHPRQSLGRIAALRRSGSRLCRRLSVCPTRAQVTSSLAAATSTKCGSLHTPGPSQWRMSRSSIYHDVTKRYNHGESGDSSGNNIQLPPRMTIAGAARLFRQQKLTSQQLCEHSHNLATFGEDSLRLNAYAKLLPLDQILEQAQKSDQRIQNGTPKSLLDGVPVTIKANIAVGRFWELPNACSSIFTQAEETKIVDNDGEEEQTSNENIYESDIAKRLLKDCGAVIIGITNMDEFGMGSLGINNGLHHGSEQTNTQQKQYSPTYNPLPWMLRLSLLKGSQQCQHLSQDEEDRYWLQQIQSSTYQNPHGINDEHALANLIDEVQSLVCGSDTKQDNISKSPLLSPGGSSSGAAASTAHGSSLLSIGTDTGGSIRLPSAWTSTVGFKPSYGTWSRYGVVSYASSLDTVGFIAGTTECAGIAWRSLANSSEGECADGGTSGWDGQICRDSTARFYHKAHAAEFDNEDDRNGLGGQSLINSAKPLENIRIGIPSAFCLEELPPLIADAWSKSANCLQNVGGATLVSIPESRLSSEWIKLALASYYVLACAEASSNLSRYDGVRYGMDLDLDAYTNDGDTLGDKSFHPLFDMKALEQQISATRAHGYGEEVQRRVLAGTSVLSSDRFHTHYEAAAVVRAKLSRSLEHAFRSASHDEAGEDDKVDAMLVPTSLSFPCKLNQTQDGGGVEGMDPTASFANDVMTIPISLGGFPSISVPVKVETVDSVSKHNDGSEQIGMQIFSSRGSEEIVLKVANTLQCTPTRLRHYYYR